MIKVSKSRILSHQQCPKRLWLERFRPNLAEDDAGSIATMASGHKVGNLAHQIFPGGVLIDSEDMGLALRDTQEVLSNQPDKPIYEATFEHEGVLVRTDILMPEQGHSHSLIEVKSATSVKDYYLNDIAIQAAVTEAAGIRLKRIELAHVDNTFIYTGNENYQGLLKQVDLTDGIRHLKPLVSTWVRAARECLSGPEPKIAPGPQCNCPYSCPFQNYCSPQDLETFPVELLPGIREKAVNMLKAKGYKDIRTIPSGILENDRQEMVRHATCTGERVLNINATHKILEQLGYPRYFMDFETINPAVPIWEGSRPYQQIPFQWSCHIQSKNNDLRQESYLATGNTDPRREFARTLIDTVRSRGPILVYNAAFEASRLRELANHLPDLAEALRSIINRIVDLLPMAREHYYHPDMRGSWSIKAVLPTIAPELAYDDLAVADGGMAQEAFQEILNADTPDDRRKTLRIQLLKYCERDTVAMVRIANFFAWGK